MRFRKLYSDRSPFGLAYFWLALLLLLPYWIHLGTPSLWDANEAFYAETPREMIESADWVLPRFNYQPRLQKPPLSYWVVAPFYRLFGVSEFSARLPAALAASLLLALVWFLAFELFDRERAWLATLVTATSFRLVFLSRRLLIDVLLALFILATLYCFVRAWRGHRRLSGALFFACLGLGFMTKGPVALAIVAPIVAIFTFWEFRVSRARRRPTADGQPPTAHGHSTRPFARARLNWQLGLPLFAGITLPWYVLLYQRGGGPFIQQFFFEDNLGRYATMTFGPYRGPTYYLWIFLADFFPWSLLLVVALSGIIWQRRLRRDWVADSRIRFCLVWAGVVLLLFTFSKNKQEYYIVPAYPAAALLLADAWRRLGAHPFLLKSATAAAASLLVLAGAAFSLVARSLWKETLPLVPGLMLAASAFLLLWTLPKLHAPAMPVALSGIIVIFMVSSLLFTLPALESYKPVRGLCQVAEQRARSKGISGERYAYYRFAAPSMVFYLRRPVHEVLELGDLVSLWREPQAIYVLMTEEDQVSVAATLPAPSHVVGSAPRLSTTLRNIVNALRSDEKMIKKVVLVTNDAGL